MIDPILLSGEEERHGVWAGMMPSPAPRWCPVQSEPPHDVELELRIAAGVVIGFAHRRLLGGRLTFWSWIDGRCRLVEPSGWRVRV